MRPLQSHSDSWAGIFTLPLATRPLSCVISIFSKRAPLLSPSQEVCRAALPLHSKNGQSESAISSRSLQLLAAWNGGVSVENASGHYFLIWIYFWRVRPSVHTWGQTLELKVKSRSAESEVGKQDEGKEHFRDVCYQVSDHWGKRTQPCYWRPLERVEYVPVLSEEAERYVCRSQPWGLLPRIWSRQYSQFIQCEAWTRLRARMKSSGRAARGFSSHTCRVQEGV